MSSNSLVINRRVWASLADRIQGASLDPKVINLSLKDVPIDEALATLIVRLLQGRSFWERVYLDATGQHVVSILSCMVHMNSIERMVLFGNESVLESEDFTNGLAANTALRYLRLRIRFTMHSEGLFQAMGQNRSIRHLHLLECEFQGGKSVEFLATALQQNSVLESLELQSCQLADDKIALAVSSLLQNASMLELNLSQNSCQRLGMEQIASLLRSEVSKLTKLDLSRQQGNMDIGLMADALRTNRLLTFLNLSGNRINDDDLDQIACSLTDNSSLQKLAINDNHITDRGVQTLSIYLPQMAGLRELWLFENLFGVEGAQALLIALRVNVVLERLHITLNEDGELLQLQRQIGFYLHLNLGGRRLLRERSVPAGLWPLVIERASRVPWGRYVHGKSAQTDIVYCLLRCGPILYG